MCEQFKTTNANATTDITAAQQYTPAIHSLQPGGHTQQHAGIPEATTLEEKGLG